MPHLPRKRERRWRCSWKVHHTPSSLWISFACLLVNDSSSRNSVPGWKTTLTHTGKCWLDFLWKPSVSLIYTRKHVFRHDNHLQGPFSFSQIPELQTLSSVIALIKTLFSFNIKYSDLYPNKVRILNSYGPLQWRSFWNLWCLALILFTSLSDF